MKGLLLVLIETRKNKGLTKWCYGTYLSRYVGILIFSFFHNYLDMAVSCDYSIGEFGGQRNKYKQQHIDIREVKKMKPDMEKIIRVLISLIEEQESVKIDYTLEKKTEDKTA